MKPKAENFSHMDSINVNVINEIFGENFCLFLIAELDLQRKVGKMKVLLRELRETEIRLNRLKLGYCNNVSVADHTKCLYQFHLVLIAKKGN